MKRIIRLTALMLAMVMLMSSCSVVHFFRTGSFVDNAAIQPEQFEKYTGAPLTSITITNESNNGYTYIHTVDLVENKVIKETIEDKTLISGSTKEVLSIFSDEKKVMFLNKLYTYGFFDLKERQGTDSDFRVNYNPFSHSSHWNIDISYTDGSVKKYERNVTNFKKEVSINCSKAFYDICGYGIVGATPQYYYTPSKLGYILTYSDEHGKLVTEKKRTIISERLSYSWNGFESDKNDIYATNEEMGYYFTNVNEDAYNYKYRMTVCTEQLFDAATQTNARRYIVTSYDYCEELTNKKIVGISVFGLTPTFKLEMDKIYVVRMEFDYGNFVEYTFNTKVSKDEIYLQRPETNLEFWITERVSRSDFEGHDEQYGWFGADVFYGLGYSGYVDKNGSHVEPEHCVLYTLNCYPDCGDGTLHVTSIKITDPEVHIYGITVNTSFDDFETIVQQHGFTVTERTERYVKAEMGRFVIWLMAGELAIGARTTNKYGIIY